jgi:hypothetical protein
VEQSRNALGYSKVNKFGLDETSSKGRHNHVAVFVYMD